MTPIEAMERTRAVIRRQHKTLATEHTYLHWLRHYMVALGGMPRTLISEQKRERFLTELALNKNVSAATQDQQRKVVSRHRAGDDSKQAACATHSAAGSRPILRSFFPAWAERL